MGPCKTSCDQDFSKTCPEHWDEVPMNPGICMAPVSYSGLCGFSLNTTRMTPDEKSAFAQKCAAKFPCLSPGAAALRTATSGKRASSMPDGPVDANGHIALALKMPPALPGQLDLSTPNSITRAHARSVT